MQHRLPFDHVFPYIGTDLDPRPLPRLAIHLIDPSGVAADTSVRPLVDSGAEYTAFDGVSLLHLGWSEDDIVRAADVTHPIYGLAAGLPPVVGYLHRVTCLIPLGRRFASLTLRAYITLPNTLSTPVLGRRDFLQQVDFGLIDAEQRFYLRFRDRSVLRDAW